MRLFTQGLRGWRSLVATSIFIVLALMVHLGFGDGWDAAVTRFLQSFASRPLDIVFACYGYLGSPEVTGLVGLFFIWWLWKKHGFSSALVFCLSGLFVTLIELLGKELVSNPGPPLEIQRWPFGMYPGLTLETSYSFPSGHMMRTFFLLLIGFKFLEDRMERKKAFIPIFLLASIMMIERVYMGDHWMSDVWGGLVLGFLGYSWVRPSLSSQRIRQKL